MLHGEFQAELDTALSEERRRNGDSGVFVVRAIGKMLPRTGVSAQPSWWQGRPMREPHIAVVSDQSTDLVRRKYGVYVADGRFGKSGFAHHTAQHRANLINNPRQERAMLAEVESEFPNYVPLVNKGEEGLGLEIVEYIEGDLGSLVVNGFAAATADMALVHDHIDFKQS
ncbi:MAG TPA: hypothetical protein VLF43_03760 [Candidatus Saccharimonadales bacterium]|nr:hypothetical protein [Candidatus Saccharimonadales bacterium]